MTTVPVTTRLFLYAVAAAAIAGVCATPRAHATASADHPQQIRTL